MAKYVEEFSPPEKHKLESCDVTDSVLNYRILLAPFQKQTIVEFTNVKLKEIAIRFLTVVNPLDKPGQFILPPPSDGVYFNMYEFSLEPNSDCELVITWQPSEYGNMRKLIKIEQLDNNRKYDFVILGSCSSPPYKKFKGTSSTYSKSKLVREKENVPCLRNKILCRDTILISPVRNTKRPDRKCQDQYFNNHFNFTNPITTSSPIRYDSLNLKIITSNSSQLDDFNFTPIRSTENFLFSFSTKKQCNNFGSQLCFDVTDKSLASTSSNVLQLKSDDTCIPLNNDSNYVAMDYCNQFIKTPEDELNNTFSFFGSDTINSETYLSLSEVEQSSTSKPKHNAKDLHSASTMMSWSDTLQNRPSFAVKNSPYYKYKPMTMTSENKLMQCRTSLQTTYSRASKQDKCDQYLKYVTNPELLYHNYIEDPFLKMSEYHETEWLNRQESDMIRWINALLTPTEKLVDDEQSGDLEQAALAWIEASKTSNENKPMQFATQKDLFAAQIYRQSPQQWKALRKASTNLFTSINVASVLSKLTLLIEKDLITVRDDRQIHLDLSLKKKIIDLLKCYNPLWLRIGLEAIYGQIVYVKPGSNDLDGVGWFVRKHLFNNDYVKQNFTKTTVLQVNLPMYNMAMKKFILRKIFMLLYFLDRAKEQQLIRHNPCLFKVDSPYKSSYDLLIEFCADMVAAHGDIIRRLRSIGYNLNHKQTHLDEVNYAVKSLNDLRDGIRITRVVEILFKGSLLSPKLRLPAISKLRKIHNVNLALNRILEHISIEGNITSQDIVRGHREKILSLFWQIIYKYLTPQYNYAATKIQNWWRNNSLKLVVLKRIRVKNITKRNLAATKIQALVRGYIIRKQWPCIQTELIKNREMLHAASTKIKLYLKDKLKLLTNNRKHFIILKRTVILIQRKFRAKIMMVKERQIYLKFKQSTLIIQKYYRGFLLRKNWLQIKKSLITEKKKKIAAVNVIKRVLRRNLPLTRERIEYLKLQQSVLYVQRLFIAKRTMKLQLEYYTVLKNTTVFIQQKFRANIVMRKEKKIFLKAKQSIVLIQKTFRGFIVRRYWADMKYYLMSEKQKRINAINIVKRALKSQLPVTQDRVDFVKLKNVVLFVQSKFRGNIFMRRERDNYLKVKQSALLIQKYCRGFLLRKNWLQIKKSLITEKKIKIAAVNVIKRVLRRNLPLTRERIEYLKLQQSVLYVQRLFIAKRTMKLQLEYYTVLKNTTVFIQQKFRANIVMRKEKKIFLKAKQSIVLIQKTFRGFIVRRYWADMKCYLMSEKQKRINAINIVKRALKSQLPVTQDRVDFVKLKNVVLFVQQTWRANRRMKIEKEYQYATVFVQSKFRANIFMQREWDNLKVKQSALLIQKVYRGYNVRKNWSSIKICLMSNKMKRVHAANIIKRILRKNLPSTQDQLFYEKLRHSALTIQRRFRANVMMRAQRDKYRMLKSSTILLQRKYLAKRAMETKRNQYMRLKTCVIRLQSAIRGYLARKHWLKLRAQLQVSRLEIRSAVVLQSHFRGLLARRQWPQLKECLLADKKLTLQAQRKRNSAAFKIQAAFRGFLTRKKLPELKNQQQTKIRLMAATKIKSFWRGYCVRKKYQCRQKIAQLPTAGAQTLGKRYNDILDRLSKQKRNEYSYKQLSIDFWNLDTCTSLSKELCVKTAEGIIVDYIFYFLQYSNQSQPSVEAREPAIRVLNNLLRYHETSWLIWTRTVNSGMVSELIKMMKTSCSKCGTSKKLYCLLATWMWIALQDPKKKQYIENVPIAIVHFKFMINTLNKKYGALKMDKKTMVLPSTRPTWFIGSKCQKCFESDMFATSQICKILKIIK